MANRIKILMGIFLVIILFQSCRMPEDKSGLASNKKPWQQEFDKELAMLGHRNWILIVDKAFPKQNGSGITYINSNEKLLPVLTYTIGEVNNSTHVKPIIYQDKELSFITDAQSKGINQFSESIKNVLGENKVQQIKHDSIFLKIDEAAKLFNVLVIKTNETIPYSSVFFQLDCAYWDAEKEAKLRSSMIIK